MRVSHSGERDALREQLCAALLAPTVQEYESALLYKPGVVCLNQCRHVD